MPSNLRGKTACKQKFLMTKYYLQRLFGSGLFARSYVTFSLTEPRSFEHFHGAARPGHIEGVLRGGTSIHAAKDRHKYVETLRKYSK